MKKGYLMAVLTTAMVLGSTMTSFAGWQSGMNGWWWQNDDGTYPTNTWQWLDGNGDGVAECYYFDGNGYMLANTTTPDGYQVNIDGAWTVNGVVQTQRTQQNQPVNTSAPTSEEIMDYLNNDKTGWAGALEIDYSKPESTSGATNIHHVLNGITNCWYPYSYYGASLSQNASAYCFLAFNENGYLLVNTTTPDGYYVNEYGMLEINGVPVVHTDACSFLHYNAVTYDVNGNLVTDKNNYPLNLIDVTMNKNSMINYSGSSIPYGKLVYNHCEYMDENGLFQTGYGYEYCVNNMKIVRPETSDENHY